MSSDAICQPAGPETTRRFAPLLVLLTALSAGIVVESRFALPGWAWLAASGISLLGWFFFWLRGRTQISAWILLGAWLAPALPGITITGTCTVRMNWDGLPTTRRVRFVCGRSR